MMKSVLFDIHDGRLPVCGLPTSSTFVKRSEWLISTWFARFTQNTQVGSCTVVTNQYATSCPSGDTRASIAPVPGAGVLIGGVSRPPFWLMRQIWARPPGGVRRATIVPLSAWDGDEYGDDGVPSRVTWYWPGPSAFDSQMLLSRLKTRLSAAAGPAARRSIAQQATTTGASLIAGPLGRVRVNTRPA